VRGSVFQGPRNSHANIVAKDNNIVAAIRLMFALSLAEQIAGSTRDLYAHDLEALESTVRGLESKYRAIRSFVRREAEALPRVEAIVEACRLQRVHLDHVAARLPARLPSLPSPIKPVAQPLRELGAGATNAPAAEASAKAAVAAAKKPDRPERAGVAAQPTLRRRYITQDELDSVSSYMRGRLTLDKINAALDEVASIAESNVAALAAARKGRATGVLRDVAAADALRGRSHYVLESDLKAGGLVRPDKSGRAVMTVLRHLGRLSEARVVAEGATLLVYVLS
jgi:hypothetical protein